MQKNIEQLALSKNNIPVWFDAVSSHAATHLADTPHLKQLAATVISQTIIDQPFAQFHTDFGKIIGTSDLVPIEPGDDIVYAKRLNRDEYTVFNKSKTAQPCSLVTVALALQEDGTCELVSAWVGPSDSPSFPGSPYETPASKDFWSKHAMAWGNQHIQPGTETTTCPW